jgi:integrase
LVVEAGGTKSWALRYRHPQTKKSVRMVLGGVALTVASADEQKRKPTLRAVLTLPAARRLAAEMKHKLAVGLDPVAEQRDERRRSSEAYTFGAAIIDYAAHVKDQRGASEKLALLGLKPDVAGKMKATQGGLAERWSDRAVAAITTADAFDVIDHAQTKGAYGLEQRQKEPSKSRARAMHSALSAMFNWLAHRQKVAASPLANLERPKPPKARERVLTDEEIVRLWHATGKVSPQFGATLKLLLLTGQRRDEVAEMRWSELNADLTLWTIPEARTKNKREHKVPLAPAAREIIRAVRRSSDTYVFTTNGRTPISGWSKLKPRLDALMNVAPWRVHDLRRTAITGMARAGAELAVIERAVNHVSGSFGGIVGVYQKHRYEDEVRAALEAWSNMVKAIVEGRAANVVELSRRGTK